MQANKTILSGFILTCLLSATYPLQSLATCPTNNIPTIVTRAFIQHPRTATKNRYMLTAPVQDNLQFPSDGRQTIQQKNPGVYHIQITPPDIQSFHGIPSFQGDTQYLKQTTLFDTTDSKLLEIIDKVIDEDDEPHIKAQKLRKWVYRHIDTICPDPSNPIRSISEILESKDGTPYEKSILLLTMARATALPAKLAVGVEYHPVGRAANVGHFVNHLWTEVYTGEWLALDPNHRENNIDATHIKLVSDAPDSLSGIQSATATVRSMLPEMKIALMDSNTNVQSVIDIGKHSETAVKPTPIDIEKINIEHQKKQPQKVYHISEPTKTLTASPTESYYNEGLKALHQDQPDIARQKFETMLRQIQDPIEAYHYGQRLTNLQYFSLANDAFNQAGMNDRKLRKHIEGYKKLFFPKQHIPESIENQLASANSLAQSKDDAQLNKSEQKLLSIIKQQPNIELPYLHLARLYAAQPGTIPDAESLLKQYIALNDDHPMPHALLGQLYLTQEDYEPAKDEFNKAVALTKDADIIPAKQLQKQLKAQVALLGAQQATQKRPKQVHSWLALGKAYREQGNFYNALKAFDDALKVSPNSLEAKLWKWQVLLELSHWNDVEKAHDAVDFLRLRPLPLQQFAYRLDGYYHLRLRQYGKSKKALLRSLVLDDTDTICYSYLSQLYQRLGDRKNALMVLKRGIDRVKDNEDKIKLQLELGELVVHENPYEAIQLAQRALDTDYTLEKAHQLLGQAYLNAEQYPQANKALLNALIFNLKNADVLALLGQAAHGQNKIPEAVQYFEKALRLNSENEFAVKGYLALIEKEDLRVKKPSLPLKLSDDENDYLIQNLRKLANMFVFFQRTKDMLISGDIKDAQFGQANRFISEVRPVIHAGRDELIKMYDDPVTSPPPRFFANYHKEMINVYDNLGKSAQIATNPNDPKTKQLQANLASSLNNLLAVLQRIPEKERVRLVFEAGYTMQEFSDAMTLK